eukprot:gene22980-biopygen20791
MCNDQRPNVNGKNMGSTGLFGDNCLIWWSGHFNCLIWMFFRWIHTFTAPVGVGVGAGVGIGVGLEANPAQWVSGVLHPVRSPPSHILVWINVLSSFDVVCEGLWEVCQFQVYAIRHLAQLSKLAQGSDGRVPRQHMGGSAAGQAGVLCVCGRNGSGRGPDADRTRAWPVLPGRAGRHLLPVLLGETAAGARRVLARHTAALKDADVCRVPWAQRLPLRQLHHCGGFSAVNRDLCCQRPEGNRLVTVNGSAGS